MMSKKPENVALKTTLYKLCQNFVNLRLQNVTTIIASHQKALLSETKSSAGDKHETGRAMLQLEMEKAGLQLSDIKQMQQTLAKIESSILEPIAPKKACLGSIIYTEKATYFLAISCGKLMVKGKNYFSISVSSPIGKLLLGKQENDAVIFNGTSFTIKQIR